MGTRLGFVGAGFIASRHLENLQGREDVEVAAVCDVDEEAAREAADPHGASVYADHREMYDREDLDAVVVGVPPFAHEDQELLAADRGVDLLVEKPLALTREKAREIGDAVAEAGLVTQVGYMNRYAEITDRARELLGDRTVGLVAGRWHTGVPGSPWWRVKEKSGGQVVEQSTHTFDLVRHFAGEVDRVSAYGGQEIVTEEIDFEDSTAAVMEHENGAVSTVSSSSAVEDDGEVSLTVVADGARLRLDFRTNELTGVVDGEPIDFAGDARPYAREMDDFLAAVAAGDADRPRSPYDDALRSFELTLAVEEALDTGEAVEVA
jgi:predicted dehydrogenase